MKTFLTFFTTCLITGLFLSSCGKNTSITKRHYNKGYYVAHRDSKIKPAAGNTATETTTAQAKQAVPSGAINNTESRPAISSPAGNTGTHSPAHKPAQQKAAAHQNLGNQLHPRLNTNEHRGLLHTPQLFKTEKANSRMHDDESLSLFWIVILVIIILWAVGLLAGGLGAGGLINILLIIALILLILWLLRVV